MIEVYDGRYGFGLWATVLNETGEFIGRCGLLPWRVTSSGKGCLALDHADEFPDAEAVYEIELAYLLAKEHWGRGLATEAARSIVHDAFERLRVPRLIALIDPDNEASLKVARNVGMRVEGDVELDGEIFPLHVMSAEQARALGGS